MADHHNRRWGFLRQHFWGILKQHLHKRDDRAILTAAAKAEEAASLLLRLGGRATDVPSDDTDSANPDAASDIALAA